MRSVSLSLVAVASGLLHGHTRLEVDDEDQRPGHAAPGALIDGTCRSTFLLQNFSLSFHPQASHDKRSEGVSRVLMADFPTMGSSYLRMMMRRIAWSAGLKSPISAIYPEEPFTTLNAFEQVYVDDDWDKSMGTTMFKSHWPAEMDMNYEGPWDDEKMKDVYSKSMHFDRVVVMLRHPLSLMSSNFGRWKSAGYNNYTWLAEGISCWSHYWEAVLDKMKSEKVHFVRFEDVCTDPTDTIKALFNFLGGPYKKIDTSTISEYFTGNYTDWRDCLYSKEDLDDQAKGTALQTDEDKGASFMSFFENTIFSRKYNDYGN